MSPSGKWVDRLTAGSCPGFPGGRGGRTLGKSGTPRGLGGAIAVVTLLAVPTGEGVVKS